MAELNGKDIELYGHSLVQIGEKVLEGSPSGDGTGIRLALTQDEENVFVEMCGLTVGRTIVTVVADAVEKTTGKRPKLHYAYSNRLFETQGHATTEDSPTS